MHNAIANAKGQYQAARGCHNLAGYKADGSRYCGCQSTPGGYSAYHYAGYECEQRQEHWRTLDHLLIDGVHHHKEGAYPNCYPEEYGEYERLDANGFDALD